MSTPFLAQIEIFSFNFAPKGWIQCNGQLLPINQNQPLFSLLGTTYGGDGRTTFGLPDLRGRVPIHVGSGHVQGERAGEETHTLRTPEMPVHPHLLRGDNTPNNPHTTNTPASNTVPGQSVGTSSTGNPFNVGIYGAPSAGGAMASQTVGNQGGNQPHNNLMPYLCLNMCMALQGIFPSRN